MTDTAKKRLAIDLDEIERQLRQSAPQQQSPQQSPKNDPLAELARIVGQDDPFRSILGGDQRGARPARANPDLDDIFAAAPPPAQQPRHHEDYAEPHYAPQGQQPHSFDEYLAEADDPRYAQHPQHAPHGDDLYANPHDRGAHAHDPQAEAYAQDPQLYAQDPHAYSSHAHAPHAYAQGQDPHWQDLHAGGHHDDYHDHAAYAAPPPPRRQSRKAALTVGAVLGVAVLGVASALVFSGGGGSVDGEPPVITADNSPIRVEPSAPDGVVIPNQNKQIFERATDEETQIVDREEQALDIREVAREAPRVVLPPPASAPDRGGEDPINQVLAGIQPQGLQAAPAVSSAVEALGEPRRVRTVSVRPDGTIIGDPRRQVAQAQPAVAEPRTIGDLAAAQPFDAQRSASAAAPQVAAEPQPAAPAAQAIEPPQPEPVQQTQPAVPPAPAAAPTPPPPMALTGALPAQQAEPARAEQPQQVASIPSPQQQNQAAQTGGYAVQLAIRDTEERAFAAFSQYQSRYASIIGNVDPIVRRAEVNGNTIYRIRVGPYALGEANTICERIKGAGGDCFVARN